MLLAFHPTRWLPLLFALACVGCDAVSPPVEFAAPRLSGLNVEVLTAIGRDASLETEADVQQVIDNAVSSKRAILFIHVDWAFMHEQQKRLAEFMLEYQRQHPRDPLMFHYVDCTSVTGGYAPLRALPGWQEVQNASGLGSLIHGHGELVWMERGRVVHVESILRSASAAELVRKTESLLPVSNPG